MGHRSGDKKDSEPTKIWPYFKMLIFLENCMQRRKLQGSIPLDEESYEEFVDDVDVVNVTPKKSVEPDCSAQLGSSTPKKTFRSPKKFLKTKIKSKSTDEKFLKIEEAKLKYTQNSDKRNDSDYQFLISLLSYLKKIPDNRKMLVRTKLQQIFLNEEAHSHPPCELPRLSSYVSSSPSFFQYIM
ncbi:hypothetical protein PGB90_002796 [Kerria lacca]